LSSITKKGEIESATNPRVVLVINNNIYLIELIYIQVKDFRKFNDWHGKDKRMWTPQNAKDMHWQKLKTLHFWFSDPRSH
jgi:hypothetical protein